jgi:hypothetical protein
MYLIVFENARDTYAYGGRVEEVFIASSWPQVRGGHWLYRPSPATCQKGKSSYIPNPHNLYFVSLTFNYGEMLFPKKSYGQ